MFNKIRGNLVRNCQMNEESTEFTQEKEIFINLHGNKNIIHFNVSFCYDLLFI